MIEGGGSSSLDVARAAAGAHGFAVGDPGVVVASLKTLLNGSFKDHDVKVATVDAQGAPRIEMVRDLVAKAHTSAGGAR